MRKGKKGEMDSTTLIAIIIPLVLLIVLLMMSSDFSGGLFGFIKNLFG